MLGVTNNSKGDFKGQAWHGPVTSPQDEGQTSGAVDGGCHDGENDRAMVCDGSIRGM